MTEDKAKLYRTARATIACALFGADDVVSVKFHRRDDKGILWFRVAADLDGPGTYYPAHHLADFVL